MHEQDRARCGTDFEINVDQIIDSFKCMFLHELATTFNKMSELGPVLAAVLVDNESFARPLDRT